MFHHRGLQWWTGWLSERGPHDMLVEIMRAPDLDQVAAHHHHHHHHLDQVAALLLAQLRPLPDIAEPAHAGGQGGQPQVPGQGLHRLALLAAVCEVQHQVRGAASPYHLVQCRQVKLYFFFIMVIRNENLSPLKCDSDFPAPQAPV